MPTPTYLPITRSFGSAPMGVSWLGKGVSPICPILLPQSVCLAAKFLMQLFCTHSFGRRPLITVAWGNAPGRMLANPWFWPTAIFTSSATWRVNMAFSHVNAPLCGASQCHGLWPWSITLSLQILAPAELVSEGADDRRMCKTRTAFPPNKPSRRISPRLPLASPFLHPC
jgi:hypothetical protein